MGDAATLIGEILWGSYNSIESSRKPQRGEEAYLLLPRRDRPRIVVPATSPRVAAAGLRLYQPERALARVAQNALQVCLAWSAGLSAAQATFGTISQSRSTPPVREPLRAAFRRELRNERLEIAMTIDFNRPHRKPAVRILSADGEFLAFSKVAWNGLTDALLVEEGRAMSLVDHQTFKTFHTPRLVRTFSVFDHTALLFEPLPRLTPLAPVLSAFPLAAFREMSALSPATDSPTPLARLEYWERLVRRTSPRQTSSLQAAQTPISHLVALVEGRFGSRPMATALSHGDWVPWNMGLDGEGRLWVWDWERLSSEAPLGQDAAHFALQTELYSTHDRVSIDRIVGKVRDLFAKSGTVPPDSAAAVLAVTLAEMIARRHEAELQGILSGPVRPYEALLRRLTTNA